MKKAVFVLSVVVLIVVSSLNAFGEGGKVRGEKGQGAVHQVQEKDPPPFN